MALSKFQAIALLVEGQLVFCTPFNEVVACIPALAHRPGALTPGLIENSIQPTATIDAVRPSALRSRCTRGG